MTESQLIGQTLGAFEIISELGRGGMATVYKARQTDLQRIVALKILPPELSRDASYLQRFQHEARSAAALEHPHIVPIYAIGEARGFHYIAMKFIAGLTLKDLAQRSGALSLPQTVALIEQVADALDYAHSHGLIHRDIKPSNMMAEPNGWLYLTDFGLARGEGMQGLTMTGTVMGTPEYMSPEQAQGLPTIGPATDIYALGVVVYELLTSKVPFQADTPMGMLVARLQYAPRPPRDYRGDLPLAVEDVIMRALARRPEARYATAGEMVAALKLAAGLGTRTFAPQQRPASPPQGLPAAPAQPSSPAQGLPTAPAQTTSPDYGAPTIPAKPVGPAAGNTPPVVLARPATPAPQPAAFGSLPATPAAPAPAAGAPAKRSRRGLFVALGALALVLALALAFGLAALRRPDPQIAEGLQAGQAALARKGGIDAAIAAYKQVLDADPNNLQAHNQLSLIYTLRDHPKLAEAEARAALASAPNTALAHALLAEALGNQGRYQEALESANQAVSLNKDLAFAYGARSGVKANMAYDSTDTALLEEADTDADKSVDLAKAEEPLIQALAHSARGYAYYQSFELTGDKDKLNSGVDEFKQAAELQGHIALFHTSLGYLYDAQGEHDDAKAAFEQALDADDQYGHTHAGLGWNLFYLGDYGGALNEFDAAIKLNPDDADAYIGKSRAFQHQAPPDYNQAIAALSQAAEAAPRSPSVAATLGWLQRSRANTLASRSDDQKRAYAAAEEAFRKALELNGRYVDAMTGLGWVLQDQANVLDDQQKYHESIDTLKESLAIKDEQESAHNGLGWSYYWLKRLDDAEAAFQRAIELDSSYADAYYGLGRTLQDLGKIDDARKAYQQAADNGSSDAQAALKALK